MNAPGQYRSLKSILLTGLPITTIFLALIYLIVRTVLFIISDYHWYEKLIASFLLFAEFFIMAHGVGYFLEIFSVLRRKKTLIHEDEEDRPLTSYPPVAIIVSSYKEPLEVVENTMTCFYNLTYPNKHLYFLDDTRYDLPGDDPEKMKAYRKEIDELCQRIGINLFRRKWHGAKAGMINDFLYFLAGEEKEGLEFYHYENYDRSEKEKYIIVFDADMNPFPDFVEPLAAIMESNPKLAFIQTPQYYTNFELNRVSRAAGLQQIVFYEYICEGKSNKDAMFCCGTNVIFRREALMDVGGFDETSVTEDFATSLKFHFNGWRSAYLNKISAFGMGPEDLGGYFKQQFRWSLGTVGLLRPIIKAFLHSPGKLTFSKWWEYFLSSTHYFVGIVFLITAVCPMIYIFFNVPTYFAKPEIYIIFFIPYIVMTLVTFYWTLGKRNYRVSDLILGQLLITITFPVYVKASILSLLGVKGTFGITPKGGSFALPLTALWPQLTILIINLSAVIWGINRLIYEQDPFAAILVNTFWCLYHCVMLGSIFYFNNPEGKEQ